LSAEKTSLPIGRWLLALGGAAAAAALFSTAVAVHLRNACTEMDTPYLPLCPAAPDDPQVLSAALRERIARNPGDSTAWTRLLVTNPQRDDGVLHAAVVVAPHNHNVARLQAAQALESGQLSEGVALLVEILRHRSSPDAAAVLAQLATSDEGMQLLRPYLTHSGKWLPQVLSASYALKVPPGDVLSLVAEAVEKGGGLPDAPRRNYMRKLKETGAWLDAYGLWLAQQKQQVPLLYNGNFDKPFQPDGFDWEFAKVPRSRAGVVFRQEAVARRGLVVGLEFTGRSFKLPVIRPYVFVAPGTYHLEGQYRATKMRSEEGLAWVAQCMGGRRALAGRSDALTDTGGVWKPVAFDFTVPPDCGAVVSVQLETAVQYEAKTGIKGRVAFDGFTLTPSVSSP
jgi:hypothetical protein